jgi:hypothetical protein
MCNTFDGITLDVIHEFLYLWHRNMEIFEFVNGIMVDGLSDACTEVTPLSS